MQTIQGIQYENDASGKPITIKINLEKYGEQLAPFLSSVGVLDKKDIFDDEWKNAISSEEFLKRSIDSIKKLPWKK
jgi:hypothetical protein